MKVIVLSNKEDFHMMVWLESHAIGYHAFNAEFFRGPLGNQFVERFEALLTVSRMREF